MNLSDPDIIQRIHQDLRDSYDEELELEIEDRDFNPLDLNTADDNLEATEVALQRTQRRQYFRELFRVQAASAPSGTSSAMCRTFPQLGRWCCLAAAGTTARGWNG